jgi:hypothetical protein
MEISHASFKSLRLHRVPLSLYTSAHKRVFFEPRPAALKLFERFNEPIKELYEEWWEKIETSDKFAENFDEIRRYHATLKPGDVTLVGLVAEGGQGMRTANNARFLGYLEKTPQANEIKTRRETWTKRWLADSKIKSAFTELLKRNGGNPDKPTADAAAWEACIEPLKEKFSLAQLGFTKSDLYRIVPSALVATEKDFQFAWERRKAELFAHWQTEPLLQTFWEESHLQLGERDVQKFRKARAIPDDDFCALCQLLQQWVEQQRKAKHKIPRHALGLRSAENYTDPADAPRIATIYNGLGGRGQFVPFRKGDPEGSRWVGNQPLCIDWSKTSVAWLSEAPEARWQGQEYFLKAGVSWTRGANHVAIKVKLVEPAIMDVNAMKLSPTTSHLSPASLLALMNSDVFSFFLKKFIGHTWMVQISDIRQMPLVIPSKAQEKRLKELAEWAIAAKRLSFANETPSNELVAAVRAISNSLQEGAPEYLRPAAQQLLLATPQDCLAILERTVNWEAEKLYGVEGQGPFDEF